MTSRPVKVYIVKYRPAKMNSETPQKQKQQLKKEKKKGKENVEVNKRTTYLLIITFEELRQCLKLVRQGRQRNVFELLSPKQEYAKSRILCRLDTKYGSLYLYLYLSVSPLPLLSVYVSVCLSVDGDQKLLHGKQIF